MTIAARMALVVLLALILFSLGATAALAAGCAQRSEIVGQLASGWGEQQKGFGLDANGNLVEFFASDAGSWTLIVTRPDGPTCIAASGTGWGAGVGAPKGAPL